MTPISDTQRAVLVKMRDGAKLYEMYDVCGYGNGYRNPETDVNYSFIERLLARGFICKHVMPNSERDYYTITPLGIDAIGKDK